MRPNLLISYAGLDAAALWDGARNAFARSREPVPRRFRDILPLFPSELTLPMRYVGQGAPLAAPSGFSLDENEYHAALSAALPQLYQGDNRLRCFDYEGRFRGGVVRVDAAWARMFPQYAPFMGERLAVRLIGGGCEAVAVPQSLSVRCAELLDGAERDLGVTARAMDFIAYVHARLARLEEYNPDIFAKDYLKSNGIKSLLIRQEDLSRAMQLRAMARGIRHERASRDELFTEAALSASAARQYQPFERACDCFAEEAVTRHTARLVQLFFNGDESVGDLWLVYEDARAYMNRSRRVLDARALCEGFQLPPIPRDGGASYPDCARVAVLHNREARLLVARTLNNPAYGSGLSPQGTLNRLVWLENSADMLRRHELSVENVKVVCVNTEVRAQEWERMARQARTQERKGRLIDELYRRECALEALAGDNLASGRALLAANERVEALERRLAAFGDDAPGGEYDADLAYLRRKARARCGLMEPDERPFEADAQRERSIECGFAMRTADVEGAGWQPDVELVPEAEDEPDTADEEGALLPEREDEPDTWAEMLATFAEVRSRMNGAGDLAADAGDAADATDVVLSPAVDESAEGEMAVAGTEAVGADPENETLLPEATVWDGIPAMLISEEAQEGVDEGNAVWSPVQPPEAVSADEELPALLPEAFGADTDTDVLPPEAAIWNEAPAMLISEEAQEGVDEGSAVWSPAPPPEAASANEESLAPPPEAVSADTDTDVLPPEAAVWNESPAMLISEEAQEDVDEESPAPPPEAASANEEPLAPPPEAVSADTDTDALPSEAAAWNESPAMPISEEAQEGADEGSPAPPPEAVSADTDTDALPSEAAAWNESPAMLISEEAQDGADEGSGVWSPAPPPEAASANEEPLASPPEAFGADTDTDALPSEAAAWNESPAMPISEEAQEGVDEGSPAPSPAPPRPPMVSTTPPPNHPGVPPQPRRQRGKKARHRKARDRRMRYEQIGMFAKPAPEPLVELGDEPSAASPSPAETPDVNP